MTLSSEDTVQAGNTRRRWFAGLATLGGLSLLGIQTQAQSLGRRRNLDPEEIARRLVNRIDRLIAAVGGTAQQKDQLVAIATAAQADLQPIREQMRQARLRGLELLAAPVIDRAALEQLRVTRMQAADAKSKRRVQAMADAAEVLTPQQRTQVAERLKQHAAHRWHG